MNKNTKIILIAVEVLVLVVLLLVGIGCQQKWIVITGDGPRFDWYAMIETQPKPEKKPSKDPTKDPAEGPAESESNDPENGETDEDPAPGTWQPTPSVTGPAGNSPTEPDPSTEPEESTTEPDLSDDEFPLIPLE